MCGIYGIVRFNGSKFNNKLLRIVLKKLAIGSKIRGRDATGYAFMREDGATVFKHNVYADEFTELDNYKKVVRKNLPGNNKDGYPYSIIGHTRQMTLGTPTNPDNNHPIKTGSIIGVHNGMISNHREVFNFIKEHNGGKDIRIAQVDSEAIFALINHHSKTLKWPAKYSDKEVIGHVSDPTSQAITKAGGKLQGSYACAAVDSDNPTRVWLFRARGDMAIHYYRKERLLIFASVENFIKKAVSVYNFSEPDVLSIDTFSGMCFDASTGMYNSFKLDEPAYQTTYMY